MSTLSYKSYEAVVDYDPDAEILHGEVTNLRDVTTFQGQSPAELKQALVDSIEEYLALCKQRGEPPERPSTCRGMNTPS